MTNFFDKTFFFLKQHVFFILALCALFFLNPNTVAAQEVLQLVQVSNVSDTSMTVQTIKVDPSNAPVETDAVLINTALPVSKIDDYIQGNIPPLAAEYQVFNITASQNQTSQPIILNGLNPGDTYELQLGSVVDLTSGVTLPLTTGFFPEITTSNSATGTSSLIVPPAAIPLSSAAFAGNNPKIGFDASFKEASYVPYDPQDSDSGYFDYFRLLWTINPDSRYELETIICRIDHQRQDGTIIETETINNCLPAVNPSVGTNGKTSGPIGFNDLELPMSNANYSRTVITFEAVPFKVPVDQRSLLTEYTSFTILRPDVNFNTNPQNYIQKTATKIGSNLSSACKMSISIDNGVSGNQFVDSLSQEVTLHVTTNQCAGQQMLVTLFEDDEDEFWDASDLFVRDNDIITAFGYKKPFSDGVGIPGDGTYSFTLSAGETSGSSSGGCDSSLSADVFSVIQESSDAAQNCEYFFDVTVYDQNLPENAGVNLGKGVGLFTQHVTSRDNLLKWDCDTECDTEWAYDNSLVYTDSFNNSEKIEIGLNAVVDQYNFDDCFDTGNIPSESQQKCACYAVDGGGREIDKQYDTQQDIEASPNQQATGGHLVQSCYALLAPLPGEDGTELTTVDTSESLGAFLNNIFRIAIGVAGLLAVVIMISAGIRYMTTDSIQQKSGGKKMILNALGGLVFLLLIVFFLNLINPNLTILEPRVQQVSIAADPPTEGIVRSDGSYDFSPCKNGKPEMAGCPTCTQIPSTVRVESSGRTTIPQLGTKLNNLNIEFNQLKAALSAAPNQREQALKNLGSVYNQLDAALGEKLLDLDMNWSWAVTEAFPESRAHCSPCHFAGTCVDVGTRPRTNSRNYTTDELKTFVILAKNNGLKAEFETKKESSLCAQLVADNFFIRSPREVRNYLCLDAISAPHFSVYNN